MKKIPTIFVRDWEGTLGPPARFVLDERHPDCHWVFSGEGAATRKYDGQACLVAVEGDDVKLYKRLEVKPPKEPPTGFVQVEEDPETGKVVGWVPVGDGPDDQWFREGLANVANPKAGTYELLGPKVQGNVEGYEQHILIAHSAAWDYGQIPVAYEELKAWLEAHPGIEGIVWHHPDGRMAKIKLKDFGITRA